jgi:hypothetical protein
MIKKAALALAILGLCSGLSGQAPASAAPVTVLKAAPMFDGRSDQTIANAVVVVEGSKIREVGASEGLRRTVAEEAIRASVNARKVLEAASRPSATWAPTTTRTSA